MTEAQEHGHDASKEIAEAEVLATEATPPAEPAEGAAPPAPVDVATGPVPEAPPSEAPPATSTTTAGVAATTPKRVVGPGVAPGGSAEIAWRTGKDPLLGNGRVAVVEVQSVLVVEQIRVIDAQGTVLRSVPPSEVAERAFVVERGQDVLVRVKNRSGGLRPGEVIFWLAGASVPAAATASASRPSAVGRRNGSGPVGPLTTTDRRPPTADRAREGGERRQPSGSFGTSHASSHVHVHGRQQGPSVAPAVRSGPVREVHLRLPMLQAEKILRVLRAPLLHGVAPHELPNLERLVADAIGEAKRG